MGAILALAILTPLNSPRVIAFSVLPFISAPSKAMGLWRGGGPPCWAAVVAPYRAQAKHDGQRIENRPPRGFGVFKL